MKKTILFIACAFTLKAYSQQLYVPRNIKIAYEKGTRSMDGNPGKNYWQNKGVYDINVAVNPETKGVTGTENIDYTNNSPDTLKVIAIRFVNNLHKPQAPRSGFYAKDFLDSGLTITALSIGGLQYDENAKEWGTVGVVRLKTPVLPHATVNLKIDWNYPLSKQSGREGQIDSSTFYCAYSYPRVSVYDDYNGWDLLPHSDRQEFYNDFNDYTLSVKVPKDYVVWATGDFLNPDQVLQPAIAARLKASYTSDSTIHIATLDEMQQQKVTRQYDWNIWKFRANDITDVCFGTSNHYVWDGASALVDASTGRRASMQAAYNYAAEDFHHAVDFGVHALKFFSTQYPGVPYPFPKMTAFQGFADMEFPMMVNDSHVDNLPFAQMLQDHEMAHTYFPFYMGINETRYAYMDEGWATTFEYLIGQDEVGKEQAAETYKNFRIRRYINDPSTEEDQPIISMSTQVSGAGYGNNSYGKASLSYLALKDLLGDDLFKKALHHYMAEWHGKHPIPWDYFNAMSAGASQNLNWFFQNWFFTNNYIDLKLDKVEKKNGAYTITVSNVGGFAIPFDVKLTYADGTTAAIHETPNVWHSNEKQQSIKIPTSKTIKSVQLDGGIFMDYTPKDNVWNG
ncbi:aminopeptidase [Arachidicoccus ginsenosidimutans]|uniref:M1 family metallopeptidase n=1 Tax=Arachidicoccus sp. BS20 TaxID=1850526 RepID=UPI0007F18186|nr:M1 family metallopeptidase [Arachidicoccus sp. BS20]ANI90019.1 aminopeptidase [Arachidicoccus sp. BS20]